MAAVNTGVELDDALRRLQLDPSDPAYCVDDMARSFLAMQQARARSQELEQQTANIRIAAEFHALLFQPDPALRLQQSPPMPRMVRPIPSRATVDGWEWVESPNQPTPPPPTPAAAPLAARSLTPTGVFVLDEAEDFMGVD